MPGARSDAPQRLPAEANGRIFSSLHEENIYIWQRHTSYDLAVTP